MLVRVALLVSWLKTRRRGTQDGAWCLQSTRDEDSRPRQGRVDTISTVCLMETRLRRQVALGALARESPSWTGVAHATSG